MMASKAGEIKHREREGLESFADSFFKKMTEIHQEDALTDVSVIVEGEKFKTHRLILAGVSDYFRAMFTHNMIEKNKDSIELHGLTVCGFKPLLEYAYSGHLTLTMENIASILEVASFLQINDAFQKCKDFLISKVDFTNSSEIIALGETYGITDIREMCRKLILNDFMSFSKTNAFLDLDYKEISSYLESDSLRTTSELELLKVALKWYNHDEINRQKHAYDVFEKIRYTQDGWPAIDYAREREPFLSKCDKCKGLVEESTRFMQVPERHHLYCTHRTRVRYDKQTLVQIGGAFQSELEDEHYCCPNANGGNTYFHSDFKMWLPLGCVGVADPRSNFATVEINGYILISGGSLYVEDLATFSHVTNEVKSLHCVGGFALWDIPYMKVPRADHVLVHCGDFLYAIAGRSDDEVWSSMECFDLEKADWSFRAPIGKPLHCHAGCEYGRKVYVSGGVEEEKAVNTMRCYDPETNSWTKLAPMQTARASHTMTTLGDRLIVVGGQVDPEPGSRHLASVEAYDPVQDKWTYLTPMRNDCSKHAATVMDGKLYIAGGENSGMRVQSLIVEYDPKKGQWTEFGHLHQKLKSFGLAAATINLNKPLIDDEDWLIRDFNAVIMCDDDDFDYDPDWEAQEDWGDPGEWDGAPDWGPPPVDWGEPDDWGHVQDWS